MQALHCLQRKCLLALVGSPWPAIRSRHEDTVPIDTITKASITSMTFPLYNIIVKELYRGHDGLVTVCSDYKDIHKFTSH